MKSFFAGLACCGLGLTLHSPIGVAAEWEPVNTDSESKSTTSNQVDNNRSTQWSNVHSKPETSTKTNRQVVWTHVEPLKKSAPSQPTWAGIDTETNVKDPIRWKPVKPAIAQEIEDDIDNEKPIKDASVKNVAIKPPVMPSGATFANDKALWRDDTWHPQISSRVPIGFGPKGIMASMDLYGKDCTTSGICKKPKDLEEYRDQLSSFGEAEYLISLSVGDAEKFVGLTFTGIFEETSIPLGERNSGSDNTNNLFSNYYIGAHLSRNLGPDTGVRFGVKNWLDVRDCGPGCGYPKSAYGVVSQRIRLRKDQKSWLPNLYVTAGLGNGEFRSVDTKFKSSIAAQRDAGCITYGAYDGPNCPIEKRLNANNRSLSYGSFAPIGSAALEIYPGLNAIGEWSEGNLRAGISVRPFKDVGLIFSSMWGPLIKNCDWGCTVPIPDVPGGVPLEDPLYTERIIWSFNLGFNLKF